MALGVPRRIARLNASSASFGFEVYRGTSLMRNSGSLGPYSRTMPRALWQS